MLLPLTGFKVLLPLTGFNAFESSIPDAAFKDGNSAAISSGERGGGDSASDKGAFDAACSIISSDDDDDESEDSCGVSERCLKICMSCNVIIFMGRHSITEDELV